MSRLPSNNTSRLLKIGLVANLLEWYEYSVYGYLAMTMGKLFWEDADTVTMLINAWVVFAISYLARPLGSFFWGYWGDRYGHARSLKISLLVMAIPTILIGLLPTYHQVGVIATISLIVLRFMQGFAAGGELPISACYIFEKSPANMRSLLCSSVSVGVGLGMLSGSISADLLYRFFSTEQILQGAWRIPYLISIPLTLWIMWIRQSLDISDAPVHHAVATTPTSFLKTSFSTMRQLISGGLVPLALVVGFMEVCCYVLLMWLPSYLSEFLGVSPHLAQMGNIFLLFTLQCLLLVMGYVASRIGYKRLLLLHTLLTILLTYPLFKGLQTDSVYTLIAIHGLFAWLYSGIAAVMMETLGNSYPDAIRSSGMSITHTFGATFFGGTTPVICTWLTNKTGYLLMPAGYMIIMGLIALPIVLRLQTAPQHR